MNKKIYALTQVKLIKEQKFNQSIKVFTRMGVTISEYVQRALTKRFSFLVHIYIFLDFLTLETLFIPFYYLAVYLYKRHIISIFTIPLLSWVTSHAYFGFSSLIHDFRYKS